MPSSKSTNPRKPEPKKRGAATFAAPVTQDEKVPAPPSSNRPISLENAVVEALSMALASFSLGRQESLDGALKSSKRSSQADTLHAKAARTLEEFRKRGLTRLTTARLRHKAFGDRRVKLEFFEDPQSVDSVLLRVRLASPAEGEQEAAAERMLSTREAAAELLVSRPHVSKLVDQGRFAGVVKTAGGHRRIPESEVRRVREEMRSQMRHGMSEILAAAEPAMRRELDAAVIKPAVRKLPLKRTR
jgi:excisionase family DNA binding protein